jgi:hypothetical protein
MSVELLWNVLEKMEHQVFERKVKEYYKMLTQIKEERKSA